MNRLCIFYDNVAYTRGDATEQEMIPDLSDRAERSLLDERGPFFILRIYFETGQCRKEFDAVMTKHGQSRFGDAPKPQLPAALASSAMQFACAIGCAEKSRIFGSAPAKIVLAVVSVPGPSRRKHVTKAIMG
jgi:hypothetical protein